MDALTQLPDGYDGDGATPPTEEACARAKLLVPVLRAAGLPPREAEPDADGGAGFWYDAETADPETGLHRNAWIVCRNDGVNLGVLDAKRPGQGVEVLRFTMDRESMAAMARKVAAFFKRE